MKKGCLLALGIAVVAAVAAAIAGYTVLNRQLGVAAAPQVSHETLTTPQTKLRAVIDAKALEPFGAPYAGRFASQLPMGIDLSSGLGDVLPYEIAIVAGSDFAKGKVDISLFINEQRGGPVIADLLKRENPLKDIPYVEWAAEGFHLRERGVILAEGTLPIPDGVEGVVLESFSHAAPADTLAIQGGHHLEISFDNRNGEILALAAAGIQAAGQDWAELFASSEFKQAEKIVVGLKTARLTGDLRDADTAFVRIELAAAEDAGKLLPMLANMFAMPMLKANLESKGLSLDGKPEWNAAKGIVEGNFTIKGIKQLIEQSLPKSAAA